jgi:hypothetical protein
VLVDSTYFFRLSSVGIPKEFLFEDITRTGQGCYFNRVEVVGPRILGTPYLITDIEDNEYMSSCASASKVEQRIEYADCRMCAGCCLVWQDNSAYNVEITDYH